MRKINKPIKFFGLSSGQFAIFMLLTAIIIIVSIFKQLHPIHDDDDGRQQHEDGELSR